MASPEEIIDLRDKLYEAYGEEGDNKLKEVIQSSLVNGGVSLSAFSKNISDAIESSPSMMANKYGKVPEPEGGAFGSDVLQPLSMAEGQMKMNEQVSLARAKEQERIAGEEKAQRIMSGTEGGILTPLWNTIFTKEGRASFAMSGSADTALGAIGQKLRPILNAFPPSIASRFMGSIYDAMQGKRSFAEGVQSERGAVLGDVIADNEETVSEYIKSRDNRLQLADALKAKADELSQNETVPEDKKVEVINSLLAQEKELRSGIPNAVAITAGIFNSVGLGLLSDLSGAAALKGVTKAAAKVGAKTGAKLTEKELLKTIPEEVPIPSASFERAAKRGEGGVQSVTDLVKKNSNVIEQSGNEVKFTTDIKAKKSPVNKVFDKFYKTFEKKSDSYVGRSVPEFNTIKEIEDKALGSIDISDEIAGFVAESLQKKGMAVSKNPKAFIKNITLSGDPVVNQELMDVFDTFMGKYSQFQRIPPSKIRDFIWEARTTPGYNAKSGGKIKKFIDGLANKIDDQMRSIGTTEIGQKVDGKKLLPGKAIDSKETLKQWEAVSKKAREKLNTIESLSDFVGKRAGSTLNDAEYEAVRKGISDFLAKSSDDVVASGYEIRKGVPGTENTLNLLEKEFGIKGLKKNISDLGEIRSFGVGAGSTEELGRITSGVAKAPKSLTPRPFTKKAMDFAKILFNRLESGGTKAIRAERFFEPGVQEKSIKALKKITKSFQETPNKSLLKDMVGLTDKLNIKNMSIKNIAQALVEMNETPEGMFENPAKQKALENEFKGLSF